MKTLAHSTMLQSTYPWSRFSRDAIAAFMGMNLKDPRIDLSRLDGHMDWNWNEYENWQTRWMVNDTTGALGRWLQGGRRLVTITDKSAKILLAQNNRISEAPMCRDEKPWRLGYLL